MRHLLPFRRRLQMRIEQRDLGVEPGLDLRQFDFGLGLDLLVNGVVLRLLLLQLRLVRGQPSGRPGLSPAPPGVSGRAAAPVLTVPAV